MRMNFELWLYTIKRLAQTMDAAKLIYDGLSSEQQEELKKEYEAYIGIDRKTDKSIQTAGRDALGNFAPEFAHINDDILLGEIWSNKDIDLKMRSVITVVSLISQGITDGTLKHHLLSAKNYGVSQKEMSAIITHTAFYAGWPKAWAALNLAKEVYEA